MKASLFLCALLVACTSSNPGTNGGGGGAGNVSGNGGSGGTPPPGDDLGVADDLAVPPPVSDLSQPPDLTPVAGQDTTVVLFDNVLINSKQQVVKSNVALPDVGEFTQITLHIDLGCPQTGCDPWDRLASIAIAQGSGNNEHDIEIGRYMTPYGRGGSWDIDVTDLRPLLSGAQTARAWIDTWSGGWTVTAKLIYIGGIPNDRPVWVKPLAWGNFNIGDPTAVVSSLPAQMVTLPPDASHAKVRVLVTGHGQGNSDNCGEFCMMDHSVSVDGNNMATMQLWRADCAQNPIQPQGGSWQYNRAGWCPGADVKPWLVDAGAHASAFSIGYGISSYVNTCSPNNCNQSTCPFGSCPFDNNGHTPPYYQFSAIVIGYR